MSGVDYADKPGSDDYAHEKKSSDRDVVVSDRPAAKGLCVGVAHSS